MRVAVIGVAAASHQLDQLLHGLGRHRRMHDDDVWRRRDAGDGDEVLEGIVRQRFVEAAIGDRGLAVDDQRIPVGGCACADSDTEIAAGAGVVLDVELLAEIFR
jgi:hypothetical protein